MARWVSQMRKGVIELCVLGTLGEGEAYGYLILQRLGGTGELAVTESTVYPILARLAKDRLVSVRVAESPSGPPRRYYRLTSDGWKRLDDMRASWSLLRDAVDSLFSGGNHEPRGLRIEPGGSREP